MINRAIAGLTEILRAMASERPSPVPTLARRQLFEPRSSVVGKALLDMAVPTASLHLSWLDAAAEWFGLLSSR